MFLERDNYLLFLRLLRKYLVDANAADLLACCLMPNHYHLFVRLRGDGFSDMMQPMLLAYTKSINNRYARTGSLFQGRFKAVLVDQETHWHYLTAYIHRNPVRAGLVKRSEDWPYSSYREYLGLRYGTLVQPRNVWEGTPAEYRRFVQDFSEVDEEKVRALKLE